MKNLLQENSYCYEFKGNYYFRKRLSKNVIKNGSKDMNFRKSLSKMCTDYNIIKNKKDIIINLTKYLNEQLSLFIKLKGIITIEEITVYTQDLCDQYLKEAIIEYSELEDLRNEDLKIIDSDKVIEGHTINAIAKEWLNVNHITKKLNNEDVVIQKAKKIIKRSNITPEQILEIPDNQKFNFYIMLIKSEKQILENDMKLYISRNLNEFHTLIDTLSYTLTNEQKTDQILSKVLNLILENPEENDYIDLIKKQAKEFIPTSFNRKENFDAMIEQTKNTSQVKIEILENENLFDIIDDIVEEYFYENNKISDKSKKPLKYVIRFFKDYLKDNNFTSNNISDFNKKHMKDFIELFCNLPIGNKKYTNETLYTLNTIRIEDKINRIQLSSMKPYSTEFRNIWKCFCSDERLNTSSLLLDKINFLNILQKYKEIFGEDTQEVSEFKVEDINGFINYAYSYDNLKIILRDSPYNFYSFIIGLLCGCRMNEIMSLRFEENLKVYEKNNQRYFYFHLNEEHKQLSLKNTNAHRNIVIPKLLIELGFLNYINKRHQRNKETIFDFTYNKNAKACGAVRTFFSRNLKTYFDNKETIAKQEAKEKGFKYKKNDNSKTQFRSLRKTFADKLFSQKYVENETELNKKRIIGHTEKSETQTYVGRLEPSIAYEILNSFDWSETNINPPVPHKEKIEIINEEGEKESKEIIIPSLKTNIDEYYSNINENILHDLPWLKNHNEDWKNVTSLKSKKIQVD
jgi:integrase